MDAAVEAFLQHKRVALLGVSRAAGGGVGLGILRRLRANGFTVAAVNPHGGTVDGEPLYARLQDVPGGVESAVVVTAPKDTMGALQACADAGVRHVWVHDNTLMPGSGTPDAVAFAAAHGLTLIPNGCPMMHVEPDVAHRCMHWALRLAGRVP